MKPFPTGKGFGVVAADCWVSILCVSIRRAAVHTWNHGTAVFSQTQASSPLINPKHLVHTLETTSKSTACTASAGRCQWTNVL